MCVHARMHPRVRVHTHGGVEAAGTGVLLLLFITAFQRAECNADSFFSYLDSQEEIFSWPQTEQPNEPGQEEIYDTGASRQVPRDIQ